MIKISKEGIYISNKSNKDRFIKFNQIKYLDIEFYKNLSTNEEPDYQTFLHIELRGVSRIIKISERMNKEYMWLIIQACKDYNKTTNRYDKIRFSHNIPKTEEDLYSLIDNWIAQDSDR